MSEVSWKSVSLSVAYLAVVHPPVLVLNFRHCKFTLRSRATRKLLAKLMKPLTLRSQSRSDQLDQARSRDRKRSGRQE